MYSSKEDRAKELQKIVHTTLPKLYWKHAEFSLTRDLTKEVWEKIGRKQQWLT